MDRKTLIVGLALALVTPLCAAAADLSWDYVDVHYLSFENSPSGSPCPCETSGDDYGVAGSKSLSDSYYLFGVYDDIGDLKGNSVSTGIGLTMWRVGVGIHRPINDTIEGFGEISYESIEAVPVTDPVTGYGVRFGLRGNFNDSFEGTAAIHYGVGTEGFCDVILCYFGIDDSVSLLSLGGAYKFNDQFALTASYEIGDSSVSTVWTFGGRFMF